jgi:hypothetical protein
MIDGVPQPALVFLIADVTPYLVEFRLLTGSLVFQGVAKYNTIN